MSSVVEIVNRALQQLGQKRINSLDEPLGQAREAGFLYAVSRDAMLEMHPWNFAIHRENLSSTKAASDNFPLPIDFLRMLKVENARHWRIEGRNLVTKISPPARIHYIRRVDDPTDMSTLFREALALKMAIDLQPIFAPSVSNAQLLARRFREAMADARLADAQGGGPNEYVVEGWTEARRG